MNRPLGAPEPSRILLRAIPDSEIDLPASGDRVKKFDLVWTGDVCQHADSRRHSGNAVCAGAKRSTLITRNPHVTRAASEDASATPGTPKESIKTKFPIHFTARKMAA